MMKPQRLNRDVYLSARQKLQRDRYLCQEFLLESLFRNFDETIITLAKHVDCCFDGAQVGIELYLERITSAYLVGEELDHEALRRTWRGVEDVMPLERLALMMVWPEFGTHPRLRPLLAKLSNEERDDFAKGHCFGVHMAALFMENVFNQDGQFSDFLYYRMLRQFRRYNRYLEYPQTLKRGLILRAMKLGQLLLWQPIPCLTENEGLTHVSNCREERSANLLAFPHLGP